MCSPTGPIQKLVCWLVDTTTKIINKRNRYCTLCMFGPCLKSSALCISPCTSSYPGQESWTKDRIRTLSWQQCQWFKQGWTSWTLSQSGHTIKDLRCFWRDAKTTILKASQNCQRSANCTKHKICLQLMQLTSVLSVSAHANMAHYLKISGTNNNPERNSTSMCPAMPFSYTAWMNLFNTHQNPTPSVDMWITNSCQPSVPLLNWTALRCQFAKWCCAFFRRSMICKPSWSSTTCETKVMAGLSRVQWELQWSDMCV